MKLAYDLKSIGKLIWAISLIMVFLVFCDADPGEHYPVINDKLAHFLVFGVLTFWTIFIWSDNKNIIWVLVFLSVYGIAIECAQYFVPGRFFSLLDWFADVFGVVMALIISKLFVIFFRQSSG